jgi:hypothetical protein
MGEEVGERGRGDRGDRPPAEPGATPLDNIVGNCMTAKRNKTTETYLSKEELSSEDQPWKGRVIDMFNVARSTNGENKEGS